MIPSICIYVASEASTFKINSEANKNESELNLIDMRIMNLNFTKNLKHFRKIDISSEIDCHLFRSAIISSFILPKLQNFLDGYVDINSYSLDMIL